MLIVEVKENEAIETALKRFKKEVEKDGILTEEKKHRFYEKPSETRKRKTSAIERKIAKKVRKMQQMSRYI
ncbi:30S ribosomal protein S21 [Thermospira aquatica]|uniref:Small ribosomal subunit protein bS21 n=1 Tax=Thermospira aquatica TaxID=2828656 RepID=A0AAX3BFC5_9SPIR|nr:30S ribosomal protein S21 [Thermospira aquatica]URA11082.1 30S ribosomal protein S21 [Thermospira aquatica]